MARWLWLLYGMGIILTVTSKCLHEYPDVRPRRQFYFSGRSLPITIEVSDRESHHLSSHILKILLEEVVGYDNVELRSSYANNMDPSNILNRISGCNEHLGCFHAPGEQVPDVMVNLEIWLPAGFNMDPWVSMGYITDAGPLGPHGRSGWFVPTFIVEDNWEANRMIVDHWRSFKLDAIFQQFSLSDKRPLIKNYLTHVSPMKSMSYCPSPRCHEGIYVSANCKNHKKKCSLLLAGYPNHDGGTITNQVQHLGLNVNVAWIGRHLHQFVASRTENLESTLFFNRIPSPLTAYGNYTRVKFPQCRESFTSGQPTDCDFEVHQLSKAMWAKMQSHTPEAHHLISSMTFTHTQYEDLLRMFVKNQLDNAEATTDMLYEQTACQWVRENQRVWKTWIPTNMTRRQRIYIGGMFPITGPYWRQPGIVPGAIMALEFINRNNSILPDYEITMIVQDTQCKADVVMKQFMHFLVNNSHPVAAILGPGCSETAEPVAGVSKHFNTIIISYSVEAVTLGDRDRYPLFFRTVPGMSQNGDVYLELFRLFNWHQVALLAEDGQEFPEYHAFLQDLFLSHGISVVYHRKMPRQATPEDASKYVEDLKKKHVKIIILTSYEMAARAVICEAAKLRMTSSEGYHWFLPYWFTPTWWDTDYFNEQQAQGSGSIIYIPTVPCTTHEMRNAIQDHMSLSNAVFGPQDSVIVGNLTVAQWSQLYIQKLVITGIKDAASAYATYAYDAMWVFALGLDKLLKEDPSALESLHTDRTTLRFMHHLNNTHFSGASGPVRFSGKSRTGIINIRQFHYNVSRVVGQYVPDKNVSDRLHLNRTQVTWVTGVVPTDGSSALPTPRQCGVELLRAVLGVDCDTAIVVANIMGVGLFSLVMVISLIIVKRRYDAKVRATRERMQELGLMSDTSWLCLDQWEVSREHVVLNRKLGEGAFGTVYGGEAFLDDIWAAVAVKTLKVGSNPEEKLDFLSEAEMMKRFEHENIVKLLGVCTRGEPAYTIMEFMLHGDLKTFLLARRQMVGQNTREAEDVTPGALTRMALDVAYGLKYLTDMKYVHRDLACRNCLVHASKRVKIGDFGMTRPMYDSDYYRFNKRGMLPVRWMAPESLTDGLFTPASDIWSYGVLLFEIMTFGSFPYQGLSNKQVLEHVKNGNSISLPTLCSPQLKSMMQSCWEYDPRQRPIVEDFIDLLRTSNSIIKPCLDAPLSAVAIESNESLEVSIPTKQSHQRLRLRTTSEHTQLHGAITVDGRSASSGGANIPSPNSYSGGAAELFSLMPHSVGWTAKSVDYPPPGGGGGGVEVTTIAPIEIGKPTEEGIMLSASESDCDVDTSCAVPVYNSDSLCERNTTALPTYKDRTHDGPHQLRYIALPTSFKETGDNTAYRTNCPNKEMWHMNGTSSVGKHAVGNADVVLR